MKNLIDNVNLYEPHSYYMCIDSYQDIEGDWHLCPKCGLYPKVWEFDNGRSTACGCFTNIYNRFSIHAESIRSVMKRTGGFNGYDDDELRINWNTYCKSGEIIFLHASKRTDEKW